MPFFFDYIYYRITKAYFKWDGREGITAIIAISMVQTLILFDIVALLIPVFYNHAEVTGYSKIITYTFVGIFSCLVLFNRYKYRKKYNQLKNHWKNETPTQRFFKGLLVLLALIIPWVILIGLAIFRRYLFKDL